jgi:hypothetical protein
MNVPSRRLLAFTLDYVLIAIYLAVLALGSLVVLATPLRGAYAAVWANAWSAELAGFFLLTAPVIVYFACLSPPVRAPPLGSRLLI